MENAQDLQRAALEQQQRYAIEQQQRQQQASQIPEHVQAWLNGHSDYLQDPVKVAELQLATAKTTRDGKTWHDPDFIDTIERHLGLRSTGHAQQGNGQSPQPRNLAPAVARPQPQYSAPVSAPPTRDVPSFSTGRPQSEPTRLTSEEAQLARSLGVSLEEYALQKQKMHNLKQRGVIVDGR